MDFVRVGFFNKSADKGFLVITIIFEVMIFSHIAFKIYYKGIKSRSKTFNFYVELIFFISNFISSPLIESYNVYLTASYLKIININRVSEIVIYFKKRRKMKLIGKFRKVKEKML